MAVIGIESSGPFAEVAWCDSRGALLGTLRSTRSESHHEELSGLVRRVVAESGGSLSELSAVVVGLGPGSFTGARIGLALAKGLATALEIPLWGECSLAAMAYGCLDRFDRVLVQVPAGRGVSYWGVYGRDGVAHRGFEVIAPSVAPDDLVSIESSRPGVGHVSWATNPPNDVAHSLVTLWTLRTTEREGSSYSPLSIAALEPLYVRPVEAKTLAERGVMGPQRGSKTPS